MLSLATQRKRPSSETNLTVVQVFEVCGREPLIEVAIELERQALADDYFVSRYKTKTAL
jgi:hypothetical protein